MKWIKKGLIFDPSSYNLPLNCKGYAQSPQVIVFDDFVRVYFSSRELDESGKFLSHIVFADFDKSFKKVLQISSNEVISLGNLGCFDEHGIFPLNVFRVEDEVYGYIGGWNRRKSVSVDGAIGLAVSKDDGLTFQRVNDGPILSASPNEPFLIGDPFVQKYNNIFHMWYIFGTEWIVFNEGSPADRVYKIGHAESINGIDWEKTSEGKAIVSDSLAEVESQALPTVIKIGDRFHMYFCFRHSSNFRQNPGRGYRIGHAYSDDLLNWVRDDDVFGLDMTSDTWDGIMNCYPHVFQLNGEVCMLYNGNEFGRNGFGLAVLAAD